MLLAAWLGRDLLLHCSQSACDVLRPRPRLRPHAFPRASPQQRCVAQSHGCSLRCQLPESLRRNRCWRMCDPPMKSRAVWSSSEWKEITKEPFVEFKAARAAEVTQPSPPPLPPPPPSPACCVHFLRASACINAPSVARFWPQAAGALSTQSV